MFSETNPIGVFRVTVREREVEYTITIQDRNSDEVGVHLYYEQYILNYATPFFS